MKLGHIELFVRDPLASKEYYESVLGFEVAAVQGQDFVWMKSGGIEILLRKGNPPGSAAYESASHGIVLYTDDLVKASDKLSQRGVQLQPMTDSDNCLAFTDPDGHWFQLVNPNNP